MAPLPIYIINFDDTDDVALHDKIVSQVEQIINLATKLSSTSISIENIFYERQIKTIDHRIDLLVYELYDLTDTEIAIVEETKGH